VHGRSDTDEQWLSAWTQLSQERPASVSHHVVAARDCSQTFRYCWRHGQRHLTHVVVCQSSSLAQLQGLSCSNRRVSRRAHELVLLLTACQVTSGFVASGENDRSNWHWRYSHAGRRWGQTQCRRWAGGHGQRQRQYFLQAAVLVGW